MALIPLILTPLISDKLNKRHANPLVLNVYNLEWWSTWVACISNVSVFGLGAKVGVCLGHLFRSPHTEDGHQGQHQGWGDKS